MEAKQLADILELVSGRVKERWREAWEEQIKAAQDSGRSYYEPYSDELSEPDDVGQRPQPPTLVRPTHGPSSRISMLEDPPLSSSMAVSAHIIYPDYYVKLIEDIRNDDL